jgi:hypothetical protein
MDRVRGLVALHPTLHGTPGRPKQAVSDLLRGALVLAVAALDGLVLDAVAESIGRAARAGELGDKVAKWAKEDPNAVLGAFASADPTAALTDFARDQLSTMTFQHASTIGGVLWDVARCPAPWERAAQRISTDGDQWDGARIQSRLDEFVKRRHRIVHAGDLAPGGTATVAITRDYVQAAVRVIDAVGLAVCEELDNRMRALRRRAT